MFLPSTRRLLCAFIVLYQLTGTSLAIATPFGTSSLDILEACSHQNDLHTGYCIGYLKSFRDWYHAVNDIVAPSMRYCEPQGISYKELREAVVTYLKEHPELGSEPRILGVLKALHATWPCPDTQVRVIQALLKTMGYDRIRINGVKDSDTIDAIASFLSMYSRTTNTKVSNHELLEMLIKHIAAPTNHDNTILK